MDRARQQSRIVLVFSALAGLVCLFGNLGAIGFVGPDEPRYAWVARAMAETGDWITPRLYGQPWFEKPILYYWAAAVGFRLHLPAEWASRLPSAFAALAAALAIAWFGRRFYDSDSNSLNRPALLAPLIFATSVAAIGFARSASPDMLFGASIASAMVSAACVLGRAGTVQDPNGETAARNRRDLGPLALFGLFLGLGVLAKGPAALVLAGGAILLWALSTGNWRAALRFAHPLTIGVFAVVAIPWYALCAMRNPDFLRIFILQHNFERYLTPVFQHRQPFWFFAPIVLVALVPWTVLLWPAAQDGLRLWRERAWSRSPGFFVACWALFPVLFFSFSQSKLPGYVLPAIPPLAILCSLGLCRMQDTRKEARFIIAGIGVTWLLLGIVAWRASTRLTSSAFEGSASPGRLALVAGALIAGILISLAVNRRLWLAVAVCAVSTAIVVELLSLTALPEVDPLFSARHHAMFMHNDQHPERIFTFRLQRQWDYGLAFYFHRELPEWSPADPEAALVLTTPAGFAEIQKLGRFGGSLDEEYVGILYVPVQREPR